MDMKETGDPREYEAFIREIDDSRYAIDKDMVPRGVIPKRRGMSLSRSLAMEGVFPFTNFAPRLLASLAASSTATCTSGVVTVTATGHNITAAYDEFAVYYPGSLSLAAGWYGNVLYVDANTFKFGAPGSADFTSESINSGNAFVDEITVSSSVIQANTFVGNQTCSARMFCRTDAASTSKTTRLKIGTDLISSGLVSSGSGSGYSELGFAVSIPTRAHGIAARNHTFSSTRYDVTINPTANLTLNVTAQCGAAATVIAFIALSLRIE